MTGEQDGRRAFDLYPYFPYSDRPRLHWPESARIAFWLAPNIEFYELDPPPSPARPTWFRPMPDILNYSWRDYANRVGVWRMMDVMAKHGVRASISTSVALMDHYPEVIEAGTALGWEWFSHGIYNTRFLGGLTSEQEREIIRDSKRTILERTGQKLSGWLGPALSISHTITNNLAAEGLEYTLDFFHDDQPIPLNVKSGRLISIPYSWVVNDALMFHQWHASPSEYLTILKRQFDRLYAEGERSATVMCVPLHPYLIAQPNRIALLDELLGYVTGHEGVWLPTAREIAAYYYEHHYDQVAAAQRTSQETHDAHA
jgi:peptidoglycan/xylan/chitin deacetylase (PgdA/CDA1 family)